MIKLTMTLTLIQLVQINELEARVQKGYTLLERQIQSFYTYSIVEIMWSAAILMLRCKFNKKNKKNQNNRNIKQQEVN